MSSLLDRILDLLLGFIGRTHQALAAVGVAAIARLILQAGPQMDEATWMVVSCWQPGQSFWEERACSWLVDHPQGLRFLPRLTGSFPASCVFSVHLCSIHKHTVRLHSWPTR